jgi:aryl-alcohol dehydrogenase-like predicted oxidoreductase
VFSPLAQGVLTGKYRAGAAPDAGTRAADDRVNRFIPRFMDAERLRRAAEFATLAAGLGHRPAQVALAWCLRHAGVASVICGASRVEQLVENAAAADLVLDGETVARLDELFPA